MLLSTGSFVAIKFDKLSRLKRHRFKKFKSFRNHFTKTTDVTSLWMDAGIVMAAYCTHCWRLPLCYFTECFILFYHSVHNFYYTVYSSFEEPIVSKVYLLFFW